MAPCRIALPELDYGKIAIRLLKSGASVGIARWLDLDRLQTRFDRPVIDSSSCSTTILDESETLHVTDRHHRGEP